MLELGRRESQMMGGLWLQILVIGVMVFAYTQAIRQLNHRKDLTTRLQEQLTMAREKLVREGSRPDLSRLQVEVAHSKSVFFSRDLIEQKLPLLTTLAQDRFSIRELKIQLAARPARSIQMALEGQPDLVVELYPLILTGVGTSRNVSGLLATLNHPDLRPLSPLAKMTLQAQDLKEVEPVKIHLEWWVAAVAPAESVEEEELQTEQQSPFSLLEGSRGSRPAWGDREVLFLSPFVRLSALGKRAERQSKFQLTGILWDSAQPACVINEQVFLLGDRVGKYTLVLMTPEAILLQGGDEELFIPLP